MSLTSLRIFVKRGALWRFNRLRRDARKLPISVEWDRRKEDRRAAEAPVQEDQRKEDRRRSVPFTWNIAEFVVVDERRESCPADVADVRRDPRDPARCNSDRDDHRRDQEPAERR